MLPLNHAAMQHISHVTCIPLSMRHLMNMQYLGHASCKMQHLGHAAMWTHVHAAMQHLDPSMQNLVHVPIRPSPVIYNSSGGLATGTLLHQH